MDPVILWNTISIENAQKWIQELLATRPKDKYENCWRSVWEGKGLHFDCEMS